MEKPKKNESQPKKISLEQEIAKATRAFVILEIDGHPEVRILKNIKYRQDILGLLEALRSHYSERLMISNLSILTNELVRVVKDIAQVKKHLGVVEEPTTPPNVEGKDEKESKEVSSEGKTEEKSNTEQNETKKE